MHHRFYAVVGVVALLLFTRTALHPPAASAVKQCHSCTHLSLWCSKHCSADELMGGLCRSHVGSISSSCQYGYAVADNAVLTWRPCGDAACSRRVHACERCVLRAADSRLLCDPCWQSAGGLCVACGETPAQTERTYLHKCKACISKIDSPTHAKLVRAESDRYFERMSMQQQWDGTEDALQVLLLPARASDVLPKYSDTADYRDPSHCRLCFQPAAGADLEEHLQTER